MAPTFTRFDENALIEELRTLPALHRVAFAASCCERLIPNFSAFAVMENWGDPTILQQALEETWNFLAGSPFFKEHIDAVKRQCYAQAPNSNQFPASPFVSAAQNAVGAIVYTLDCCLDSEVKWAALVGRVAIETLDSYLYLVNTPYFDVAEHIATIEASFRQDWLLLTEFEKISLRIAEEQTQQQAVLEWIQASPLMVAELEHQRRDIELLKSHATLDQALIEAMRQSSTKAGIRPIVRFKIRSPQQTDGENQ